MTENFTIPATTALRENHHLMADATRTNTHQVETDGLSHPNVTKKDDIPGAVPGPSKPWGEDFIKDVVNKTVDEVIRDSDYSHEATSIWVNQIVEIVVRSLVKVDRDNKYIVTCMVVQNLKQGMRSATSCYWSSRTDSGYSLTNERNGMYVITTVFVCQP
ncbi:Dynein light chain Tctex-type [Chondrus crispus]|uniref:Dynein light chain Tctex-type n=1 Tax=Chondrus crispus TaxID=2769 RepID=R7QTF5_CHOCR|nr:Dynein light chain Tctex-type [Chondrus crispus]CDF40655.1 Dynein light chain Tctex-type [Chondrus crispus]|eukprot:XP_005710949.1 Dynein light chain Tctex-type [Chondrus crispus]